MTTGGPPYNVRVERTRHMNAPIDRVAAVLEDTAHAAKWNPMLDTIAPATLQGQGMHSSLTWQAHIAGVPLSGTSEATAWDTGKSYAWVCTERMTPGSVEGRFMLAPVDAQHTDVTARLASDFPPAVASLFYIPAVTRYFEEAVDESLANIEGMAATP
jgi:Polyketide cyclase / dehydrase and lipid transport